MRAPKWPGLSAETVKAISIQPRRRDWRGGEFEIRWQPSGRITYSGQLVGLVTGTLWSLRHVMYLIMYRCCSSDVIINDRISFIVRRSTSTTFDPPPLSLGMCAHEFLEGWGTGGRMGLQENCTQYSRVVKTNPETSIGSQLCFQGSSSSTAFVFPSILSISSFLKDLPTYQ